MGGKNAPVVLFNMLKSLEYRGYDSAGIAYVSEGKIHVPKDKGKVDDVRAKLKPETLKSHIGVGHTRWATHGVPSQLNAHPHADCTGDFVVAHNGIIENHAELKQELSERGHTFRSETDTEVIAHLMEEYYDGDLLAAFKTMLGRLKGSFAITVLSTSDTDAILVARNESPLLIGLGRGENYVASDAPAFISETKEALILEDLEYGIVKKDSVELFSLKTGEKVTKTPHRITWSVKEAEKGGYHHFMLKEIYEEPQAAANAIRDLEKIRRIAARISKCRFVYFVGCGTAYHAGLYGKYLCERMGLHADAVIGSEFRYSTVESINEECAVVAISQSGETADTLAAVKEAGKRGAYTAAFVNVVGSSITRACEDSALIHAGPEIAVASTKAYIGQLVCVAALAFEVGHATMKLDRGRYQALIGELKGVGGEISQALSQDHVRALAEREANTRSFFYLGRRENYPTALEGALKLKEISYVHAEGYAAGELKHGPLALMNEEVVVIVVTASDELKHKVESNVSEVKARGARVYQVGPSGDIRVPKVDPLLAPIVNIVPLHLFAYYISVLKGLDPDKPRNLAKSVTVE